MIPTLQLGQFGMRRQGGAVDPNFANVSSLLHFDGPDNSTTFTDVKGLVWTAQNSARIETDNSKFGGASGWFKNVPGSGSDNASRITTPDTAALRFGTGAWTIEGWFRPEAPLVGFGSFWRKGQNTADGLSLAVTPTLLTLRHNGTTDITAAVSLTPLGWFFIQFIYNGSTLTFGVNGVSVGSSAVAINHTSTDAVFVGSVTTDSRFSYNGYIDDLRQTKGVARALALPTDAFPNA